jgi:hypothetical protein
VLTQSSKAALIENPGSWHLHRGSGSSRLGIGRPLVVSPGGGHCPRKQAGMLARRAERVQGGEAGGAQSQEQFGGSYLGDTA